MARRTNHDTTHYLRWFFTEAPAAVSGMRSSYWTLVEMAQSGAVRAASSGEGRTPPARQIHAASRESDIAARLERLTAEERVILSLAFGPSPWPVVGAAEQRDDRRRFGEHPGVALVTERAHRAFAAALRKRERKAGEDDRELVTRVDEGEVVDCGAFQLWTGRVDAWRRGADPRAGIKAMLDRGLVSWLRGPAVPEGTLKDIREECAGIVRATVKAWEAVAPKPDSEGRVRHDGHRRAAYGPATAVRLEERVDENGDRISDVVPIHPFVPWREGVA